MSDIPILAGDNLILLDGLNLLISDITRGGFTEFLNFQDSPRILLGKGYLPADTLALTDAIVNDFRLGFAFGFATLTDPPDQLILLDSILVVLDAGRIAISVQDNLNLNDLQQSLYTRVSLYADSLSLSDFIQNLNGNIHSDTVTLSDVITASLDSIFSNFSMGVGDTLNLSDSLQLITSGSVRILLSERIRFFDSISVTLYSNNIPYLRRYLNDVTIQ